MNKKYVAVFCSAADLDEKYTTPTKEFARMLGKAGYHLVWGGSNVGLMRIVADEVEKLGGELIGVSIEVYNDVLRQDMTETIVSSTLGDRKATMLLRSDAIVVLPGGVVTLDEITEIIELKQQRTHKKPIIILNIEHFYDGLKEQLQKMQDEGFMHVSLDELMYFAENSTDAIDYLHTCLQ